LRPPDPARRSDVGFVGGPIEQCLNLFDSPVDASVDRRSRFEPAEIEAELASDAVVGLRRLLFSITGLHQLPGAQSEQHADHDDPHLADKSAPAVEGLGKVQMHNATTRQFRERNREFGARKWSWKRGECDMTRVKSRHRRCGRCVVRGGGDFRMSDLSEKQRDSLDDDKFAFPKERKEPLEDADHVRNAIARFNQVEGVSDSERDEAWRRIKKAAKKFDVEVSEDSWHELNT
jgi:hypothetical protein